MDATGTTEKVYKSPPRKLLTFFERSRNQWKAKHHAVMERLIKEQHQVRAVEKSRAAWQAKADAAEQRVRELEQELARTKNATRPPVSLSKPSTAARPDTRTASG